MFTLIYVIIILESKAHYAFLHSPLVLISSFSYAYLTFIINIRNAELWSFLSHNQYVVHLPNKTIIRILIFCFKTKTFSLSFAQIIINLVSLQLPLHGRIKNNTGRPLVRALNKRSSLNLILCSITHPKARVSKWWMWATISVPLEFSSVSGKYYPGNGPRTFAA